jgi:hypothetical protein
MGKTDHDWSFSNFVHEHLAKPKIYQSLKWKVLDIAENIIKDLDINHGIDYVFQNETGDAINVQERFRDNYYAGYNDATLRYRRDFNPNPERIESEFYKIKANYLVYGITNGKKFADQRHTLTDFMKWVVLDLKFIQQKFKEEQIKIVTATARKLCWLDNNILHCPENHNPDGSSSFIPFDISLIKKLWGNTPLLAQKGFL